VARADPRAAGVTGLLARPGECRVPLRGAARPLAAPRRRDS